MSMLSRIAKQPVSLMICLAWIVVWVFVVTNKNTLDILCGKGIKQIGNQYYRFFTAGLTHTHILHMLANVCAMFWIGYLYEQRLGSVKFLLVSMICAIVCQVVFLAIYSNATESFGGSGYNFALIGFGLALQFLTPDFPKITFGTWSGNWLIIYLILGNIPVLSFMNITTIIFHAIAFVLGIGIAFIYRGIGV